MATLLTASIPWHDGECKMHQLLRVPYQDNPTVPFLSPSASLLLKRSPLLAIGALDQEGRPWCSLWGGEEGLAIRTSTSSFGIRTPIGKAYDPVVESLLLNSAGSSGKAVAFLAVDLENRRRVKLFGKLTAGSLGVTDENERIRAGIARLTVHVDGSLDCFFITSSHGKQDMDTNIRGGPSGFVRVASNEPSGAVLAYLEYSGNRLYQTLGNLQTNPLAGYVFPDFETGNALFVTGRTEIHIGKEASSILPRSNAAARLAVTAARYVEKALSFRGIPGKPSPYNPTVRHLTTEKPSAAAMGNRESSVTATMIGKEIITPSIGRFRFRVSDPREAESWTPGQYVTLSFYDELDMGYSHMMDDDPSSLKDDYIRTFTVSSSPDHKLPNGDFEITVRKHGNVTRCLFQTSDRAGLEIPLKGFGGDFQLPVQGSDTLPFIAGGIGITPVLAQLPVIDVSRLRLFWTISAKDIALVSDTFKRFPALPSATTVFVTGADSVGEEAKSELEVIKQSGTHIKCHRIEAQDLVLALADVWYFCGSPALKVPVFNWLAGKKVLYEDFNY
ncbi:putative oxidoreductase, FAD-binding [Aspergillus undulatus]|uniref:putative oxidoreductase, FAD-binding n=1 Tax=Aspergillus undulatus TaxID=1810928 RepID=UPI003CCD7187